MSRRVFFSFLIILCTINLSTAQKRAFGLEDLYRVKNLSDLHISPDGKTILFAVATPDLARAKKDS